jgi:DNA-binding GntR family transcriptional regulator
MTAARLVVTDHALARYMARILGMEIEDMRRQIEASLVDLAGSTAKYATRHGVTFVLGIDPGTGNTVVMDVLRSEQYAANEQHRFNNGKQKVWGKRR